MDLKHKRVIVVGLGRSGIAAANLAVALGAQVTGTDSRALSELPALSSVAFPLVLGGHTGVDFNGADLIVVSPGVPALPELAAAEAVGVPVIGELDFGVRLAQAPVSAVGGTNGKSTTTTLLASFLQAAGKKTFAGGNLGVPFSEVALLEWEQIVLEVSSFQLERAPEFRPKVSILLNITEDHLDRYIDFQAYADAKGNAFLNQSQTDVAVIPSRDALCLAQARRGRGRVVTFGPGGDYVIDGNSALEVKSGASIDLSGVALHGGHNQTNFLAAFAAARALGVAVEAIAQGARDFKPLHHRMARVRELAGVTYYDDSKGTNVGASVTALLGLKEPRAVLIAGGRDKQGSYAPLVDALRSKGRALVLIGEAAALIAEATGSVLPVKHATDMPNAVALAQSLAEPGDAVLLSPACSSFDMFSGYAARGDAFVEAVLALPVGLDSGVQRAL